MYPGGGIIPGGRGPAPRGKGWRSLGGGTLPCIGGIMKFGLTPRVGVGMPGGGTKGLGPPPCCGGI